MGLEKRWCSVWRGIAIGRFLHQEGRSRSRLHHSYYCLHDVRHFSPRESAEERCKEERGEDRKVCYRKARTLEKCRPPPSATVVKGGSKNNFLITGTVA